MKLQKLTAAELPESVYHGEEYKDFVSGSVLWDFINRSPAEAVYGEKKDSAALKFGTLAHTCVLESELFESQYARDFEAPEGCLMSDAAMRSWLRERGVAGYSKPKGFELVDMVKKADPNQMCFIDEQSKYQELHEGKEFLKPDLYEQLIEMRETMAMYQKYRDMIDGAECESSIIGESEALACLAKTRPDIWNGNVICNYKTVSSAKPEDVLRDCYKFGYFMKEYLSALMVQELTGEFPVVRILAQSKTAPYVVTGITLTEDQLDIGRAQLEKALAVYKACTEHEAYIDYAQGQFLELETPQYMLNV